MKVEFLGTGGAIATPRAGCECRVCATARAKGVPFSRSGPSTFVHGPDVLIDTPEEIRVELARSTVRSIRAAVYSHWHPDHVMGRRLWEMNADFRGWPPRHRCTPIYVPEQVARDFRERLGTWDHLQFFANKGLIRIEVVPDGQSFDVGDTRIHAIRLAESYVYAFLFEEPGCRVLIAPDELFGWVPPDQVRGVDFAVVPIGIMEKHPLTGERLFAAEHPLLRREATFEQTLDIVRTLGARRVAFTHFEEPDGLGYEDHQALEARLRGDGLDVVMAYDGLVIDVPRQP